MKFHILSEREQRIIDLSNLRQTSKDFRLIVNEFVKGELAKLSTQGPSLARAFLATQEPVTSANAWRILGLFKKAYPSLRKDMSIEQACQQLAMDQATIALKHALVRSSPQVFADLGSKQTAAQIRDWLADPQNHPSLQGVTTLNLGRRDLFLIPEELSFLPNLQRLYLDQNQLTSIDRETFANLQNLQVLGLSNNNIRAIAPQTFSNLQNLSSLGLSQNQLTAIDPQTFSNLANLRWLYLDHNKLTSIDPQTFANLKNLENLYLGNNQLTSIDHQTFASLQNLQVLALTADPITQAGPIDRGSLGLSENVILMQLY